MTGPWIAIGILAVVVLVLIALLTAPAWTRWLDRE